MKENKNKRLVQLDIAKGFAVIFMILVHVCEMFYVRAEDGTDVAARIIEFLGSPPAAPVFMVSLGVGVVYSRHNTPAQLARRGLILLVISYIYNIVVYTIPYLISYAFRGHDKDVLEYGLTQILSADILQFAALAFLFMALALKLRMKEWQLVCLAVLAPVLGKCLESTVEIHQMIPAQLLGLIWRTNEMSYFPFLSWIFFPVAGYVMAHSIWPKARNKVSYQKAAVGSGLLVYLVMMVIAYYAGISFGAFGELYQEAYYGMGLYGNICLVAFVVFWVAACFFLQKVLPEILQRFLTFLSKNMMKLYVCQYFLIYYISVVVIGKENSFSLGMTLLIAVLMEAACCIVVLALSKLPIGRGKEELATAQAQTTAGPDETTGLERK